MVVGVVAQIAFIAKLGQVLQGFIGQQLMEVSLALVVVVAVAHLLMVRLVELVVLMAAALVASVLPLLKG